MSTKPFYSLLTITIILTGVYMATRKPRGIRNNNPGNIRHGDNWQGMAAEQTDKDFIRFESPEMGIRAMYKVLLTYRNRYGLNTPALIISRWAPPNENNTAAYIASVAKKLKVDPDQEIDLTRYLQLMTAIIQHENGQQPYSYEQLKTGIELA